MISEAVHQKTRLACMGCRESSNPDDISDLECTKCHQRMVKKFTKEEKEKESRIQKELEAVKLENTVKEKIRLICIKCTEDKKQEDMDEKFCFSCRIKMKRRFTKELNKSKKKRFLTIRHLRTDRYGSVTVACLVSPQEGFMDVGFSLCSPNDTFSKRDGRTRALKRMNKNPIPGITSIRIPIDLGSQKINEVLMEYIGKEWSFHFPRAKWMVNFLVHVKIHTRKQ